jgi:hypothetical protein
MASIPKAAISCGTTQLVGWTLRTLALMANLSRAERERVLKRALKVNRV